MTAEILLHVEILRFRDVCSNWTVKMFFWILLRTDLTARC